ncbi:MAG: hypothetical protein LZF86_190565 [Nitrospira sp.]|nr:MAG: hypothetical protein LZF86_190565 [Nitrospira sp.]
MDAIGSVIDRQLDTWQQRNSLLFGCLAQCVELIEVKLVVIGDDAQPDVRFLQRIDIVAVVKVVITHILEFAVGPGVQMKVCAYPLRPFVKNHTSAVKRLHFSHCSLTENHIKTVTRGTGTSRSIRLAAYLFQPN